MSLADARAILPTLASAPAQPEQDRNGLELLANWCGRYGPARNIEKNKLERRHQAKVNTAKSKADLIDYGIWIDVTGVSEHFVKLERKGNAEQERTKEKQRGSTTGAKPRADFGKHADVRTGNLNSSHERDDAFVCGSYSDSGVLLPTTTHDKFHDQIRDEQFLLADMMRHLRGFGLTPRIALADTYGAAYALARFGARPGQGSCIAPPGKTREALHMLPVDSLCLDEATVLLLKRLGLRRVGQLYDLPRPALERRFSSIRTRPNACASGATRRAAEATQAVIWRLDQALGRSAEPGIPMNEPARYVARRNYPELLISSEPLLNEVAGLAAELASQLTAAGLGARRLRLSLYRAEGTSAKIIIGTSSASREANHFMRLIGEKIEQIDAGFGIELLIMEALHVEPVDEEQPSFDGKSDKAGQSPPLPTPAQSGPANLAKNHANRTSISHSQFYFSPSHRSSPSQHDTHNRRALSQLIDRLANRLGAAAIYALDTSESHIPERRQIFVPAMPQAMNTNTAQNMRSNASSSGKANSPRSKRPPLLLPYPEPIAVLAALPDRPPVKITWRRITRRIVKAQGPERIAPEWWQEFAGSQAGSSRTSSSQGSLSSASRLSDNQLNRAPLPHPSAPGAGTESSKVSIKPFCPRDYYHLEDDRGGCYWVFQHGFDQCAAKDVAPAWFMHGLF